MRTINRKLVRELSQSKAQSIAIGAVIASGVAVFVMSLNTLGFLSQTRDAYYDRYRFADLFASVTRAPMPLAEQIAQIPGVAEVQTRIVSDVNLDVPGLEEPAIGHLVSIPDDGEPKLNNVYLRKGRWPEPDRQGEVLVSDAFFEKNHLRLGDQIGAILNGRWQPLRIVGVGLSPEFVLQIRAGDMLPDERRYAIFWMPHRQMEAAFDMDGAFNNVTIRLLRGASERDVIDQLDRLLKPYGAIGAFGRDLHTSARFLADEIKSLRSTGLVAPVIFLGVAAFLLNVVLTRRINTHRVIIAGLKAFGYSNMQIGWHYMQFALVIAGGASVLGLIAGQWMGLSLAELYVEFYRFPSFVYHPDWRVMLLATSISLGSAAAGSMRAVRSAVTMQPAEAMRPPAPRVYRRTLLEIVGLTRLIPITGRMILRDLERRPISAAFSSIGIAFAVSVMVLSGFFQDAVDYLIEFQFTTAQRHDVQVAFYQVTTPAARHDLKHLPGVQAVEPFRAVAVNLRHQQYEHRTSILGLDQQRDLFRLLDTDARPIPIPPSGVVLGDALAEILHVVPGDTVTMEVLEGAEPVRDVIVAGLAREYTGTNAYMDRRYLNRLLRETDAISGAFLAVDSASTSKLYRELKQTPQVASATIKSAMIQQFRDTIEANQMVMQSFTIFFAAVISIGVVYNTARISLDEQSRELATLRVIGMTRGEVSAILLGELAILTLIAIPLGWLIGYGFCAAMVIGFESQMFRIPLIITTASYAWAAIVIIVASAVSGLMVRRRLDRLDLVSVLKSGE